MNFTGTLFHFIGSTPSLHQSTPRSTGGLNQYRKKEFYCIYFKVLIVQLRMRLVLSQIQAPMVTKDWYT